MDTENNATTQKKKGSSNRVLTILLVIAVGAFLWSFFGSQEKSDQIRQLTTVEGAQEFQQEEVDKIVSKVGKLIILPDEIPNLAIIEDAETLATQQAFFSIARNGDQVLFYSDKVIIYRPDENIIVNVGPIFFQGDEEVTPSDEEATLSDETMISEDSVMEEEI